MRRKIQICFIIIALIGLLIAGTSTAYFTESIKAAVAKFTAGTVKVEFQGYEIDALNEYVDNKKVTWSIKNVGTNAVFLRAKPIITKETDTNIEIALDAQEEDGIIPEVVGEDWEPGRDGYYYYNKPVEPNDDTVKFELGIRFDTFEPTDLDVDLEVEAIQATNDAINQVWPENPF